MARQDRLAAFEQRLAEVEALFDSSTGQINYDALPLDDIRGALQSTELGALDAAQVLQHKSVLQDSIGVLPGGRMEKVLNQNLADNTWTKIDYGRVRYDLGGFTTPSGVVDLINDRLVIRVPGIYVVTLAQEIEANLSCYWIELAIRHYGAGTMRSGDEIGMNGVYGGRGDDTPVVTCATIMDFAVGDYVEGWIFQRAAAPALMTSDQYYGFTVGRNHMAAHWLGTGRTA